MSDELREKAKIAHMNWSHTTDPRLLSELMADFAAECVRAERERIHSKLDTALGFGDSDESWVAICALEGELRGE